MIYDNIENANLYTRISERIEAGLNYLQVTDFTNVPPGKYTLITDEVIANVNEYHTRPETEVKWEAHRKFADIQYIVKGEEIMGFAPLDQMSSIENYNEEKDVEFFAGEGNYVKVKPGDITIFFPHDAHRPGIVVKASDAVKKVVIKILVE